MGLVQHLLKSAYLATGTSRWTFAESSVVDFERDVVVMRIDHFADIALTGVEGDEAFLPLPGK